MAAMKSTENKEISLRDINSDVLMMILEEVLNINLHTLSAASRTCKDLYRLAVPFLYRTVYVNDHKLVQRLRRPGCALPSFIRNLHVRVGSEPLDGYGSILAILRRIPRLQSLHWSGSCQLPPPVAELLRDKWPRSTLHVTLGPPCTFPPNPAGGHAAAFPNLGAVKCRFHHAPQKQQQMRAWLLGPLRSSPGLRRLDIGKTVPSCVAYRLPAAGSLQTADAQPGDGVPQLEELRLGTGLRSVLAQPDMALWLEKSYWANLRRLKLGFTRRHILQKLAGHAPQLESLELVTDWEWFRKCEPELLSLGNLRELSLSGPDMRMPLELLKSCGSKMEKLSVHWPEYFTSPRPMLSATDVEKLGQFCPRLKALSVDMDRQDEWPYDFLRNVVQLPLLTSLHIFAEATRNKGNLIEPLINEDSAKTLFSFLRKAKVGSRLRTFSLQRGGTAAWKRGQPDLMQKMEWEWETTFYCSVDPFGHVAVTQPAPGSYRGFTIESLRDISDEKLSFTAQLVDRAWWEKELVPRGIACPFEGALSEEEMEELRMMRGRILNSHNGVESDLKAAVLRVLMLRGQAKRELKRFGEDAVLYDIMERNYEDYGARPASGSDYGGDLGL